MTKNVETAPRVFTWLRETRAACALAPCERASPFCLGAPRADHGDQAGTTLTFDVTCPGDVGYFSHYTRDYTADGSQLWLFQQATIEVYEKRP